MNNAPNLGNGSPGQGFIPTILGVVDHATPLPGRYRGMPADEALAVAQLRRYGHDRRQAKLGRAAGDLERRGRPGSNSTNRYDARLVRILDFGNALSRLTNLDSTLLQMHYGDGENLRLISKATGISERTLSNRLPLARQALVRVLEESNLL